MTIRSTCRPPGSWAALPVTIKLIHHPARHGVAGIRTSRYRLPVDPPHIPAQEREAADLLLLRGVQRGDPAGLDALIDRYWLALVAYAARLLGDWDAAEDAGQEAFVRLWERREQWTTEGSVRALLYQMVRNVALNQLKGDDTHSRLLELRPAHPAPRTPVEELSAAEVQRAFEDAVAE